MKSRMNQISETDEKKNIQMNENSKTDEWMLLF